ncbi:hypothetical protein RCR44_18395 [Enterobacter asburiae]|nr:hypothetical protein [Enterobacter asburiae]WMQ95792.1 hypothetical protein RCR44_18395 [Enterobacter asburiae]WMR00566.1 hypothetical protein RCR45_18265 [Enterobacter asburiae]
MGHNFPVLAAIAGEQPPAVVYSQTQVPGAVHTAGMDAPRPELA